MPSAECRRFWLQSSIHVLILARAAALVAKCSTERSSNSRVECQDPLPAVAGADPGLPIDWPRPFQDRFEGLNHDSRLRCCDLIMVGVPGGECDEAPVGTGVLT